MQAAQNIVQEADADDVGPHLLPLALYMEGCATQDEMNANVLATIERGYTRINEYLNTCDGPCAIVGSAPSIRNTCTDLKGDVLAINGAIGYLLERGIVPRWAMIWDAADLCEAFAVPHPDVTYLIGARCHPKVFERLAGCKVIAWHAGGDHNIAEFMSEHNIDEPMINGGSAGVTRAMFLAVALGYKHLNVYGADSSYDETGATHIAGSLVPEKDLMIWIGNGASKKLFRTTPEWCAQVNEFRDIYQMFRHPSLNLGISVHGQGMLPRMAELMKMKDDAGVLWNADGTPGPGCVTETPPAKPLSMETTDACV